ncbi:hypothetical protein ASV53_24300 [Photobacterium sanguinicancri]|uniref:Tyr recombinase domain-containing protein n=2 Tax=Photobacterium sanguinicancri TaxID=875932 RepID=A0ABX4FQT9_9GAMM|nr:hypothetical protein ASV53_24300 [Photobacterium sanguinicancri]
MELYNSGKPKKEYQYWIPLLLRYTGARLNELAQLYTDDIVNYCGVWCMEIYPMINGQKVKTKNSARIVPISIHLINHGFIDYVKTKKGHIFHELPLRISGYGDNASKWASRWRSRFGYGRDLTLHSFRNRYVDELKKLNVEERYAAELCGHGYEGFTYSIYGHETDPRKLFEIVNLIDNRFTKDIHSFNR